ncbi:hypothetical protein A5724_19225 [Mycobacterium sp. ACS1612]|uniref:ATP-binding protein n=1 Tax=Mycobacterium sp. ACS1612 TaxID=1834117 RepID=UPI00080206F0|nr:ATP-binding protein [Mycobacterium sp. ACS1612]OBF33683.1 hypothetical protein A5724_19225 [Mycobacterium sp. ACS1612]
MDSDHALLSDADRTTGPTWLAPWLAWLDAALHREILRLRARYELSLDELRGLYVSDEQVDRIVMRQAAEAADADRIAAADETLRTLLAAAQLPSSPLHDLARRFELPEIDLLAVVVCLAPEVDLAYQPVFAYLNDDVARRMPSVDLCHRLGGGALQPASPAIATGLLEVHRQESAPLWRSAGLALAEPVRRHLIAARRERLNSPAPDWPALTVLSTRMHQDAEADARTWASQLGRELVAIDTAVADPEQGLRLAVLAARLADGAVHVAGEDAGIGEEPAAPSVRRWCRLLAQAPVPVLLSVAPDVAERLPLDGIDYERLQPRDLDVNERAAAWSDELLQLGIPAAPGDVKEVAAVFRLSAAQIHTAAMTVARTRAGDLTGLRRAARQISTSRLIGVAQPVRADYDWDDLVLPRGTTQRLKELAGAIRHRDQVFGQWRFGRLVGGHTSVRALFTGPSGTGKTMATAVLGRELGLEVFRVDLSAVVSKYIGETEKNIERILAFAEHSNAIVFFDEADALFGKRSEVHDSHDRYANIETAFLLQRLEAFDGIAILASNLPGNLDDAFSRRLHFHIEFPPPDDTARLLLWERTFPPDAPLADDIAPDFLAAMLPLTGGEVRTASLQAAFLAADEGGPITMGHIVRSIARLRRQQGKLPSRAEFKEYLRLVLDEDR